MTDKYEALRAELDFAANGMNVTMGGECAFFDVETIRALVAERDALRESLRWTAAALQDATASLDMVFEEDRVTVEGVTKTVAQILDAADAALGLAQHQGEKHGRPASEPQG